MYEPANFAEEIQRHEVVTDVAGLKGQSSIPIAHLRYLDADLAVLHHSVMVVAHTDHAHLLCGLDFLHHLLRGVCVWGGGWGKEGREGGQNLLLGYFC